MEVSEDERSCCLSLAMKLLKNTRIESAMFGTHSKFIEGSISVTHHCMMVLDEDYDVVRALLVGTEILDFKEQMNTFL